MTPLAIDNACNYQEGIIYALVSSVWTKEMTPLFLTSHPWLFISWYFHTKEKHIFKLKDIKLERFLRRILLDLEEPLKRLNPLKLKV